MIAEGTYQAKVVGAATVWQAVSNAVMVLLNFRLDDGNQGISKDECLIQKDGTISQITVGNLKKVFGWDGVDPFWLEDPANTNDRAVELVIEHEQYEGKTVARVKYVNVPGGNTPVRQSMDRKGFLAKFGSQFRAMAGSQPVKTPPKPPTPPAAPKAVSTVDGCWEALQRRMGDNVTTDQLNAEWFRLLATTGKRREEMKPEDWGKLLGAIGASGPEGVERN